MRQLAVVIGGAFEALAESLVEDLLLPPIGLVVGSSLSDYYWTIGRPDNVTDVQISQANTVEQALELGCVSAFDFDRHVDSRASTNRLVIMKPGNFFNTLVKFILVRGWRSRPDETTIC